MSIYRFSGSSTIAEVRFHVAPGRSPVAVLTAAQAADAATLQAVQGALKAQGLQCTPVFANGNDALQVTGFKDIAEVSGLLRSRGLTVGEPQITMEEQDLLSHTRNDWLNRSKLKIAGWLNFVGDLSLLAAGIKAKDKFMIAAGGLYTAGALALGLFGSVKTDRQLRETSQDTAEFIQQRTGALPQDSQLSDALSQKRGGALHSLTNYLYRHPADIMLGAYTAGAATMLASGIASKNKKRIGYGIWSLAVKLTSFLLPEKKQDDDAPKKDSPPPRSVGGFIDWIKEKPLRLFGYGSMITEVLLAGSAWDDFKNPEKRMSGAFGLTTAGMYILSDILMATSSKDPSNADGKFNADESRRLEALAAEAIAKQPEAQRVQLANEVGGFLAKRPEMKGKGEDIAKAILEQAEHLGKNRWAVRVETAPEAVQIAR